MAIATIYRPDCETNYTKLPNILAHPAELGLKVRDVAVLQYFLTKDPAKFWHIYPETIASALNMGYTTVKRALTQLRKLGFADFTRNHEGYTHWFFKIPERYLNQKPQSQKPSLPVPSLPKEPVYKTNDLLEINEETTNAGSVVVSLPDYVNKTETVKNELGALDAKLQVNVLKMLASAMLCAGKVKNPTAYLLGLARNAAKGSLSMPAAQSNQAPATAKTAVKPNNLDLINLRNELANIQRLYKLSPNESLLSQIQAIEAKLNNARMLA